MTVRGSGKSVEARLRCGRLACWCGGEPRPRGEARPGGSAAVARAAVVGGPGGRRARFAGLGTGAAHEVAAHLTGGMLLAPALPPLAGNTTLAAVAAVCSS